MKRLLSVIIVLAVALGVACLYYGWGLRPADPRGEARLIYLPPGQGVWAMASVLRREGVVRSAPAFYIAYRLQMRKGQGGKLPGSYFDISPADSVPTIISTRLQEPAVRRVTFPEGFSMRQMAERIGSSDLLISEQAFVQAARPDTVKGAVAFRLPKSSLEGYLFPDTYEFPVGTQAGDVIREMVKTFQAKFYHANEQRIGRSAQSLHELVTIASLIEREAKLDKDRRLISSVIHNRLRKGMRLQIDATVQYALPRHKQRLLHSDLRIDSPYNTYLHAGLPPGPICNPGLACLEAALNPAQSDYLYYVARPDGSHIFSTTYAEHLAAIKRARAGGR